MKDSFLMKAMEHLDSAYIAEASPAIAAPMKRLRRRLAMKWTSVAAGFCAALLLIWQVVIPYARQSILPDNPITTLPGGPIVSLPDTPTYDHALYTAEDIGNLFNKTYGSLGTSSYTEIYTPDEKYLKIVEIPDDDTVSIYRRKTEGKPLDTKEFTAFADRMMDSVSSALDIARLDYTVEAKALYSEYLEARFNAKEERDSGYSFDLSQYGIYNTFGFNSNSSSDGRISLHGIPVMVDQTKTDDEIIASLTDVKNVLFDMFGVHFDNVRIDRGFTGLAEPVSTYLSVFFYKDADDPLNKYFFRPGSDFIWLLFDNDSGHEDDSVGGDVLSHVTIHYFQYRTDDVYSVSNQVRMISLEEAEWFLYNGYVFGGHSCPICMSMQSKVDFKDYDFVGFTYMFEYNPLSPSSEGLPFYEFYKKIGTSPNGNSIYALTYVPAVEVNGYKEYFEKQQKVHESS